MLSHHQLMDLLFLSSSALLTTTIVFAVLWVRARERAIRATLETSRRSSTTSPDLQHLVHAVDSIAVEVERISEGQRFTTQLLSERVQPTTEASGVSRARDHAALRKRHRTPRVDGERAWDRTSAMRYTYYCRATFTIGRLVTHPIPRHHTV